MCYTNSDMIRSRRKITSYSVMTKVGLIVNRNMARCKTSVISIAIHILKIYILFIHNQNTSDKQFDFSFRMRCNKNYIRKLYTTKSSFMLTKSCIVSQHFMVDLHDIRGLPFLPGIL